MQQWGTTVALSPLHQVQGMDSAVSKVVEVGKAGGWKHPRAPAARHYGMRERWWRSLGGFEGHQSRLPFHGKKGPGRGRRRPRSRKERREGQTHPRSFQCFDLLFPLSSSSLFPFLALFLLLGDLGKRRQRCPTTTGKAGRGQDQGICKMPPPLLRQRRSRCHGPSGRM